jgi:PAS domain S-box-containing protein
MLGVKVTLVERAFRHPLGTSPWQDDPGVWTTHIQTAIIPRDFRIGKSSRDSMPEPLTAELVRSVLDSAPDAMIIIATSGTILFANHQVSALFGYATDEVIGRKVEMLLPERFRARHVGHRTSYGNAERIRPMGIGLDLFALRADGAEFPVEISLSPIRDGGETLVAAAIRDVSERKRADRELQDARAQADRANLAKSRFLATASHDLRQPLQSLALLIGALRRQVNSNEALEALALQEVAVGSMSRLLNALLDISKLESGAVVPDIVDFRITTLFDELRAEFAGVAASKGLQFSVDITQAQVRSDPSLVGQILRNLIANAIKYTQQGSVWLRSQLEEDALLIEVRDSGIGIAKPQLGLIFDEFYQVGVSASSSREGYGLGLSIVQRLAHLLDLRVEVQSSVGTGSTFSLRLPLGVNSPATTAPVASTAMRSMVGQALQQILLVEDDPGVRNATRMFLKGEGFAVTTAATAEEALSRAREDGACDLIVSDLHLGGDALGTDVIVELRKLMGKQIKAILVTGDTSSLVRDLKCDDHLRVISKPIDADELLALIRELLP